MTQEVISDWVTKAKSVSDGVHAEHGIKVIRRQDAPPRQKTKGETIMDMADRMWPSLMKLFADVRGEDGMLMQPAHVRGIALNVAQDLVNKNPGDKK